MGRRKGLADRLFETGTRLVTFATETVLRDPRGQEAVARAIGAAQRGRKRFEGLQISAMRLVGLPGRQDYQDLAKQLARIKRKARELDEKLARPVADEAEAALEDGDPGTPRTH